MTTNRNDRKILVGITGASGSIYASRLIDELLDHVSMVYVIATDNGRAVAKHELEPSETLTRLFQGQLTRGEKSKIRFFECQDLFAPVASGTNTVDSMVVVPCSMGSMARIAHGMSSNLLERSADVVLKQRRQLIVCPRETPLNLIHLRNMTVLAESGAEILPLMPGFYHKPSTLDDIVNFCVGRILDQLRLAHENYKPWNARRMR